MRRLLGLPCVMFASPLLADQAPPCVDCADGAAIEIDARYTGEVWRQASGGIQTGNRYLDNLDVIATADGGKLFGLQGLELFGYALYNNGHVLADELSGAVQGITNIEATEALRLYELWSQWEFGSGGPSLRFGLYDLNSEFDSIESAGLFINPSHGIGPDFSQSGANGPSIFPVTSLGLRTMHVFDEWSAQAAILDGVPGDPAHPQRTAIKLSSEEGALLAGEVNYRGESGVRVGAGYWRYTADFDDVAVLDASGEPRPRNDNAGAYLIAESPLLLAQGIDRGLRLYMRVGAAEERVNAIGHYVGAGAVYSGLLAPQRDQLGIAAAIAELGEPFRRAQAEVGTVSEAREYNYEATYRFAATESFALQADVQYVDNPGMDPSRRSGWVFGLRFEIASVLLRR